MTAHNLAHGMMRFTAITAIAGVLAVAVGTPGWAQQTTNSEGRVVDGKGGGGAPTNNYNWTNGAAYYEPHSKRINQAKTVCPLSGPQRNASCLHQRHHGLTDD